MARPSRSKAAKSSLPLVVGKPAADLRGASFALPGV
jgi:hypothetical protein